MVPGQGKDDRYHLKRLAPFPQASNAHPSPMSLSPDAPLEVLRDHIVPAALSNYIGKIVTVCGMFLVCYEWGEFYCCSLS